MKKNVVRGSIVLLICCVIIPMLSCTKSDVDNVEKIVFWDSYYIGVNDANIPESDWYITQAISRFNDIYPDIQVEYVIVEHSSETIKKFSLACEGGTGPDIVTLWSSAYAKNVKDALLPLDSYITQEERETITGWDTVMFDGITYGYPTNDSGVQVIYYNKAVLERVGLDFDSDYPKTMDEFYAACEVIKNSGETPLLISYKNGGMDAATMSYWFGQMVDSSNVFYDLAKGKTDFSEQSMFIYAAQKERNLYINGYTNADVLSADESSLMSRFIRGDGAMIIGNTWYIDSLQELGDQVGIIPLPSINNDAKITGTGTGGPGLLLGISASSTQSDSAIKFIKFLMSRDEMIEFCNFNNKAIPNRKDIDVHEISTNALLIRHADLKENGYVVWLDNVLPSSVCDVWFQYAPLYFTNQLSDDEYLDKLNAALYESIP